jgi:NAD-dependent SIR2 family protein deacetylase
MLRCQNCESHVTERYAKVFTPPEIDRPRVCPNCSDMVRSGGRVREAKTARS